ncbi:MAG: hypothetical protein QF464_12425, partial [Myxococcota bacterium]|nr:hypothetical protein [Myxococcota bacterium]
MTTPTTRLQAAVDTTRDALDAGEITRLRASRRVARHCRVALRRHPYDLELGLAVSHVAARGFVPPPRTELPAGEGAALWYTLTGRQAHELEALAASFVAWPKPTEALEEASRLLDLFLLVPTEHERANALLEALAPLCDAPAVALWRFRMEAAQLDPAAACEPATWATHLEPLRALGPEGSAQLAVALMVASSAVIAGSTAHGTEWLYPVLGGQMVLNIHLALRRRPALRDELGDAIAWLEEARPLIQHPPMTLVDVLAGVDDADMAGDFTAGTAQLEAAVAMAADRHDIVQALAARAALLGDPTSMARASALGAQALPFTPRLADISAPPLEAPDIGLTSWTQGLRTLASPDFVPTEIDQIVFLERAGSRRRAALGWMARGEHSDLLQAARLGDALTADVGAELTAAMLEALGDDELALGQTLFGRLTDEAQRTVLALRLGAVTSPHPPETKEDPQASTSHGADDDPHSLENRLAAAEELLEADRSDAAGAILAAVRYVGGMTDRFACRAGVRLLGWETDRLPTG